MDKKKITKIAINALVFCIPFGIVAIGGYYGYKKYRKIKNNKKEELENSDTKKNSNGS